MSIKDELIMSYAEHMDRWVKGDSIHNGPNPGKGECCPDYSCCFPELLAPKSERLIWVHTDDDGRGTLAMIFLQRLLIASHPCPTWPASALRRMLLFMPPQGEA
jgi:hypothetical protein